MLQPDANYRITMPQLLKHPWVARDMPPALWRLNADLLRGVSADGSAIRRPQQSTAELVGLVREAIREGRCDG